MKRVAGSCLLFFAIGGTAFAQNNYQLDPSHTSARFGVKHMMISQVHGLFHKVSGTAAYDPKSPESDKLEATIEMASVDTNEPKRDGDLKSPDFFDVAKFPTMVFRSTRFEKRGNQLVAIGTLTLHGVTKPLTLTIEQITPGVKDPYGMMRFGAHATGTLNRKDYGITFNAALETGGVLVSDKIGLEFDISAIKTA